MSKAYWIRRKRAAVAMARGAATSEARLAHYEMAGRYSIRAANCPPFLLVERGPATEGEREALKTPRPASIFRIQPIRPWLPGPAGRTPDKA